MARFLAASLSWGLMLASGAEGGPSLVIAKRAHPAVLFPAETVRFAIEVRNDGTEALRLVHVYDFLANGCTFVHGSNNVVMTGHWSMEQGELFQFGVGPLAPGEKRTVLFDARVAVWARGAWVNYALGEFRTAAGGAGCTPMVSTELQVAGGIPTLSELGLAGLAVGLFTAMLTRLRRSRRPPR